VKPVVLVCRPATGGMRTHIISLLSLLDRSRWQVTLAAPRALLGSLPSDLPPYSPIPLEIPTISSPSDLAPARMLSQKFRSVRKEAGEWPIVHAHGLRAAWISAWASLGSSSPLVVTLHNLPEGRMAALALSFIARRAERIVCVSQAVFDRVPGQRKCVIPNGIDLARFAATDRARARREFGIGANDIAVAAAARLSPEKGIDLLLRAAAVAPDMIFLIAGSGPDERRLAQAAPKNVRLLGRIQNVEQFFAACDIAVVPSRSEGQGIVALEAMATGASIVVTNVGGLGQMITDGINGLVIAPDNPDAILEALVRLRDNPDLRERLAEAGREWVKSHADVRNMVAALEEVYEAAARGRG